MTVAAAVETAAEEAADTLRACFQEALGRDVCLRPGNVVELLMSTTRDECCEGAAWVRVGPIYPGFPDPDDQVVTCWPTAWSVVLEMGAARCAMTPGPEDIPTCDEYTALTRELLADSAAMLCAVACFIATAEQRIRVAAWEPAPIEGRCAGGTMQITVAFEPCLTCPQ